MPVPFAWEIQYYPTLQHYAAALRPFPKPGFLNRVAIHHTWKPTADEWRGRRTMDVLGRYYRGLGWPSGPHLFLAPDGLWAGTPLAVAGTHAGLCNRDGIGLEIVGNFDQRPWDEGLRARIYQLVVVLLHWLGATETKVKGHRECGSPKTCPGAAIALDLVRRDVGYLLFDQRFIITTTSARVREYARVTSTQFASLPRGAVVYGHPVLGASVEGDRRWARVRIADGRVGFVWAGLGRWEPI